MNVAPVVSIIVPVYNVEAYLDACLASIKRQTYQNFELILINDCTTDESEKIIYDFLGANPQISASYIKHDKNRGISAARNSGMRVAKGEYIYFIDSDDDMLENCLEELVQATSGKPDVVIGENYIIDGMTKYVVHLKTESQNLQNEEVLNSFCRREWYNQVWNKLYRTNFLLENNLWFAEGMILEDELWSFEIASIAKKIRVVNIPTYNYYIRPKSIISSIKGVGKRWEAFYNISQLIEQKIKDYELTANPYVGKYFLDNLIVILTGFQSCGQLTKRRLDDVTRLSVMPLMELKKHKQISTKQLIAYSYFELPTMLKYWCYRLLAIL